MAFNRFDYFKQLYDQEHKDRYDLDNSLNFYLGLVGLGGGGLLKLGEQLFDLPLFENYLGWLTAILAGFTFVAFLVMLYFLIIVFIETDLYFKKYKYHYTSNFFTIEEQYIKYLEYYHLRKFSRPENRALESLEQELIKFYAEHTVENQNINLRKRVYLQKSKVLFITSMTLLLFTWILALFLIKEYKTHPDHGHRHKQCIRGCAARHRHHATSNCAKAGASIGNTTAPNSGATFTTAATR